MKIEYLKIVLFISSSSSSSHEIGHLELYPILGHTHYKTKETNKISQHQAIISDKCNSVIMKAHPFIKPVMSFLLWFGGLTLYIKLMIGLFAKNPGDIGDIGK